jgi:hypothetical protein
MRFSGECYSSEDNFRACHWDSSGSLWSPSMCKLVGKDCQPPEWLEGDSICIRLQNLMQILTCEMGDLIGVRKDLKTKDMEKLVIMKVQAERLSSKAALNSMVDLFNSNTRDSLRLTEFLRNKYAGNEVVVRHLGAMDILMHGSFRWSSLSKTYRLDKPDCIRISYREEDSA